MFVCLVNPSTPRYRPKQVRNLIMLLLLLLNVLNHRSIHALLTRITLNTRLEYVLTCTLRGFELNS